MATIAPTNMLSAVGAITPATTTLTSSDTFTFNPAKNPVLILRNGTGGALTVNIDGADGTTVAVPGATPMSVSAGYSTPSIPAGSTVAILLNPISAYLQGVIAVTGGVGISAQLLEF